MANRAVQRDARRAPGVTLSMADPRKDCAMRPALI